MSPYLSAMFFEHLLRLTSWIDLEAALWAVIILMLCVVLAAALRGRLPLWRKGLWLCAMIAPLALSAMAAELPKGTWALTDYLQPRSTPLAPGSPSDTRLFLAACYLVWIGINLLLEAGALLHLHRLLRTAEPVQNPLAVAEYTHLAKSLGLLRAPQLVQTTHIASPFIAASFFRGLTIVLPQSLVETASPTTLRAVLAHELAHARAADPYLQRAWSLCRIFLPLTWICSLMAMRLFWEDAAEQTGDLRAIRASGVSPASYAAVLKDMALGNTDPSPAPTLAFSPAMAQLRPETRRLARRLVDRLHSLKLAPLWSESWARNVSACCRALGIGGILLLLTTHSQLLRMMDDPRPVSAISSPASPALRPAAAEPHLPSLKSLQAPLRVLRRFERWELHQARLSETAHHAKKDHSHSPAMTNG